MDKKIAVILVVVMSCLVIAVFRDPFMSAVAEIEESQVPLMEEAPTVAVAENDLDHEAANQDEGEAGEAEAESGQVPPDSEDAVLDVSVASADEAEASDETGVSEEAEAQPDETSEQLSPPESLRAEREDGSDDVRLSWEPVPEAAGYRVYRSKDGGATYGVIGDTESSVFLDHGVEPGAYHYTVEAYGADSASEQTQPVELMVGEAVAYLRAPKNLSAHVLSEEEAVRVTWDGVPDAEGYRIYRAERDGEFRLVGETTASDFLDSGLEPGVYYYQAVAHAGATESEIAGPVDVVFGDPGLEAPSGLRGDVMDLANVKLQWDRLPGAGGYRLYRADSAEGSYRKIAEGSHATYLDGQLEPGTYFYRVQAYIGELSGELGEPIAVEIRPAEVIPAPQEVVAELVELDAVRLSWSDHSGQAEGYYIYRAESLLGHYVLAGESRELSYVDKGLPKGSYFYTVVAFRGAESGAQSRFASVETPPPPAVSGIQAVAPDSHSVRISWSGLVEADRYRIERSGAGEGAFALAGEVDGDVAAFQDFGLTPETAYDYRIIAYRGNRIVGYNDGIRAQTVAAVDERVPQMPAGFTVTAEGPTVVRVEVEPTGGNDGYRYYYSRNAGGPFQIADEDQTDDQGRIYGLRPGTAYYFAVRGYAGENLSPMTEAKPVVTPAAEGDLQRPDGLAAESVSSSSIRIRWNPVEGAETYSVYRSDNRVGEYRYAGSADEPEFRDQGLFPEHTYYYRVEACGGNAVSDRSPFAEATTLPFFPPFNLEAVPDSGDSIALSWQESEGALGYRVLCSPMKVGPYSELGDVEEPKFLVTGLEAGKPYYFKVEAFNETSTAQSAAVVCAVARVSPPGHVAVEPAGLNQIRIVWEAAPEAKGYRIYRSQKKDSDYHLITSLRGTAYRDTGLAANTIYYYKVEAYSGKTTAMAGPVAGMPQVFSAPTYLKANSAGFSSIRLEWRPVDHADGYRISRSSVKSGPFSQVAEVREPFYVDTGLQYGDSYYYRVESYNRLFRISATAGPVFAITRRMVPPTVTASSDSHRSVRLSWTPVPDAGGYRVLRSRSYTGGYRAIATVTGAEFTDRDLHGSASFYYKVEAFRGAHAACSPFPVHASAMAFMPPERIWLEKDADGERVIFWDRVPDVEGYRVYRRSDRNGDYELVNTQTAQSYRIPTAETPFSYRIEAYCHDQAAAAEIVVKESTGAKLRDWLHLQVDG